MKPWYTEGCEFEAEVVEVRGGSEGCRCGHEVGDSFRFAYNTPANLCGELYHRLYPELHALRAGGDMRNFRPSGEADVALAWCPSRVVRISVRARRR